MMKTVSLLYGDITTLPIDALVNSANKSLLGGGGLDYIIHKKAGPFMKEACIQLNKDKGGCKTGSAEVTIAGNLPAKFIIHAVGPRWLGGEKDEAQLLCDTYRSALFKANEIRARTIAFPSISTGVYSFPKQMAAEIAIGGVLSTLPEYTEIEKVFFVCFDIDNYMIYKNILFEIDDPNLNIFIHPINE